MISEEKKIRCAIYSRKSHEEGLDQDFNSLDAQRAAAEAYVQSQVHEGWKLLPARYDDGGFSGGNMDRPALNALIDDNHGREYRYYTCSKKVKSGYKKCSLPSLPAGNIEAGATRHTTTRGRPR